jgi:hypothetical protein
VKEIGGIFEGRRPREGNRGDFRGSALNDNAVTVVDERGNLQGVLYGEDGKIYKAGCKVRDVQNLLGGRDTRERQTRVLAQIKNRLLAPPVQKAKAPWH